MAKISDRALKFAIVIAFAWWCAQLVHPVFAQATGSATLSWIPPTTNTDGSPYTNPAGFRVYWGTAIGNYPNSVTLNNAGLTMYVVTGLTPATWYFVVTARNTAGVESAFSNVASKLVRQQPDIPILTGGTVVGPEGVAYVIFQSLDDGRLVPIGTVPPGTLCNGNIGFRDPTGRVMYAVPKASVDFEADADAELVFARCE